MKFQKNGVSIGAHPSFKDPENFGRMRLNLSSKDIAKLIIDQINILAEIAEKNSMKVTHVKPHGALNNMACENFELANVIAKINYRSKQRFNFFSSNWISNGKSRKKTQYESSC